MQVKASGWQFHAFLDSELHMRVTIDKMSQPLNIQFQDSVSGKEYELWVSLSHLGGVVVGLLREGHIKTHEINSYMLRLEPVDK